MYLFNKSFTALNSESKVATSLASFFSSLGLNNSNIFCAPSMFALKSYKSV